MSLSYPQSPSQKPQEELLEDMTNMMRDYSGNLIPVTGWFCGRCILPLYTDEEIGRRLHWHCELTD